MEIKSVVRDNALDKLKRVYQKVEGRYLKGEERKTKLCSLFLSKYKETLNAENSQQLQVIYADMLEIVRTLMVITQTNVREIDFTANQSLDWYAKVSPSKQQLKTARIDLLQKFNELLTMKTEAIKDQLADMLKTFKQLIEAHKLSFAKIEEIRRAMFANLGGYSKGVYLESVSMKRTNTVAYST